VTQVIKDDGLFGMFATVALDTLLKANAKTVHHTDHMTKDTILVS
jgi:hypothetical protein